MNIFFILLYFFYDAELLMRIKYLSFLKHRPLWAPFRTVNVVKLGLNLVFTLYYRKLKLLKTGKKKKFKDRKVKLLHLHVIIPKLGTDTKLLPRKKVMFKIIYWLFFCNIVWNFINPRSRMT